MNINDLVKIYNILCTISTKGEDTVKMAECLSIFYQFFSDYQKQKQQRENNQDG